MKINDGEVSGYARRFGHTDTDLMRAQDHAYSQASEHDGGRAFHVIEVGPFIYPGDGTDEGGIVWVVDTTALEELQDAGEPVEQITSSGVDPDEDPEKSPSRVEDIPPETPHCIWVFQASKTDGGWIPSMVYQGVSGHFPLSGNGPFSSPWVWGPTYEDARRVADDANAKMGISPERAQEIMLSSFAAHNLERRG